MPHTAGTAAQQYVQYINSIFMYSTTMYVSSYLTRQALVHVIKAPAVPQADWDELVALEAGVLRMRRMRRMLTYADVYGRARCPRSRLATYATYATYADVC